jgi:hypothetical protein
LRGGLVRSSRWIRERERESCSVRSLYGLQLLPGGGMGGAVGGGLPQRFVPYSTEDPDEEGRGGSAVHHVKLPSWPAAERRSPPLGSSGPRKSRGKPRRLAVRLAAASRLADATGTAARKAGARSAPLCDPWRTPPQQAWTGEGFGAT